MKFYQARVSLHSKSDVSIIIAAVRGEYETNSPPDQKGVAQRAAHARKIRFASRDVDF